MSKQRELPAVLEHDFIITDESINRYGWRLLVAGIDLSGFLKNPVCCVQHATCMVPVGRWKNLRIEGKELKGTAEFDRNDPEAVRLYWKYTDGYMSAVSLNIIPLEESEKPEMLIQKQTRPTVTKSELLEISLVTVPGQKNAVKLSTPGGSEYRLYLIGYSNRESLQQPMTKEQLKAAIAYQKKLSVENLIALHKTRGVNVSEGETPYLISLGTSNYDLVKTILENRQVN